MLFVIFLFVNILGAKHPNQILSQENTGRAALFSPEWEGVIPVFLRKSTAITKYGPPSNSMAFLLLADYGGTLNAGRVALYFTPRLGR